MATNSPSAAALALTKRALLQCKASRASPSIQCASRAFATTQYKRQVDESERPADVKQERPRWSYTPEAMKAPFSPHITKKPSRKEWSVNEDPKKLGQMYNRLLGQGGDRMLPEEVMWQAVTHKSFDQGRRGFNDRLAFLGRQAVVLEVAQDILSSAAATAAAAPAADEHVRQPYKDAAVSRLDNLNSKLPHDIVSREKLERLALDVGLDKVLRWKPRIPTRMKASGRQIVLNGAVHAIIGAISLQHGAEVAGKIIRERILAPLKQK